MEVLEAIARARGCLKKQEELDYAKASLILFDDFRSGKMGGSHWSGAIMKTIAEIKAEFAAADMSSYPALYEIYKEDTRSGVQKADRTVPQKGSSSGSGEAAY